jgi:hypothetical protein
MATKIASRAAKRHPNGRSLPAIFKPSTPLDPDSVLTSAVLQDGRHLFHVLAAVVAMVRLWPLLRIEGPGSPLDILNRCIPMGHATPAPV